MEPGPNSADGRPDRENEIFAEAIDLPPEHREAFVRMRSGGDEGLVEAVLALLKQFERLGSFLDSPATPAQRNDPQFAPGTALAGRFRLVRQLGQGGMGVVYLAEDQDLGETIALKMVREIWLDDPGVLARFRDEIRLARKIAQPNVCRIYDLFNDTAGGRQRAFFTMEYLDGRSLGEQFKTPASREPGEILAIVRGIAAGLDAAHDAGIVHRDLKPGNIILMPGSGDAWRPVIMDFGLAQALVNQGGAVTGTGQIVGSPDYMAPEQFLGERVTPATDVFSLAVIAYEMATGSRPWPGEGLMKTALRRVSGTAIALDCGPGFPRHWNTVLENALARDPALRPQRAGELWRQLEDSLAVRRRKPGQFPRFSRRKMIFVSATAVALSLSYAFYRYKKQEEPAGGEATLALTPIAAYAGYTDSQALDFLMHTQLRQSAHVQILDQTAMENAWKRMHEGKPVPLPSRFKTNEARELALLAGARFVLFSSISRTGDDYKLELKLEGLGSSAVYPAFSRSKEFQASDESALMSKTRDASVWVRTALGEMPVDISARASPPEALTTGNWRALQEFLKAEEAWREDINGRRADESIRRLKMALELDPGFALAAGRLGDLLVAVGQEDEGLRYQQMAIGLMDQRDLTDRQSLKIRGMYYQDTGQDEKAENLFSLWAIEYPTEGVPLFYKSKSLMRLGRTAEAFALRSRAARLEPDNFALRLGSAQALLEAGDPEGADRAAALLPAGGLTDRLWSCIAFGRYQLDQVRLHLERMRGRNSDPFLCESYALSACLLAEQGQWGDAEKEIQPGIRLALDREIQTSIFANKLILAKIYLKQEKMEAARRECGEILELKPGFRRTMEVGCVLARTGATALAKGCMTRPLDPANKDETYLATPVYIHWRKRLSAEIAIAEKRGDGAARFVADAPPPALLDDWPEYLASAYLAAGKLDRAREPISALLQNPGRYWRLADTTGPGFFRWSVEQAIQHRLFAAGYADLVNLQKALHV